MAAVAIKNRDTVVNWAKKRRIGNFNRYCAVVSCDNYPKLGMTCEVNHVSV